MPTYDFQCSKQECGQQFEAYVPLVGQLAPCTSCGGVTEKVWSITHRTAASAFPYVTTNILPGGKPIEVKSAKHLDELCRRHNVTHRPDAAWLTQERTGFDFRTGRPTYSEGSGVGMPGGWI